MHQFVNTVPVNIGMTQIYFHHKISSFMLEIKQLLWHIQNSISHCLCCSKEKNHPICPTFTDVGQLNLHLKTALPYPKGGLRQV